MAESQWNIEYINRTTRIDMDYIHSTLQECLNGNTDEAMINKSLALVEKHRDKDVRSES